MYPKVAQPQIFPQSIHAQLTFKEKVMKNSIHIQSLTYNDGTKIEVGKTDIVVFTGANNSGKSQVLRDIMHHFKSSDRPGSIIITKLHYNCDGDVSELKNQFTYRDRRVYEFNGVSFFNLSEIDHCWRNDTKLGQLTSLFVNHLTTEHRLNDSKDSDSFNSQYESPKNPIQALYIDDEKAKNVSDLFHEAFGAHITLNMRGGSKIPIHVGNKLSHTAENDRVSNEYLDKLAKQPTLEKQGDGMRSFASILLNILTSKHSVTLIDEPEAFLHPPQARLLGKMLVKKKPNDRQLIISTHSEDFLKGLLDADSDNVKIVRINRVENVNNINILVNEQIKKLWKDPLLRYSNILSGLFHKKVVVCESDTDCRFYQAIMDAIYDDGNKISPDILFTHCGGKDRIKSVVAALKALNIDIIAVADIDILNDKKTFQDIANSFGIEWNVLDSHWNTIDSYAKSKRPELNTVDIKKQIDELLSKVTEQNLPKEIADQIKDIVKKSSAWTTIKKTGKTFFNGDSAKAFTTIYEECKLRGLFIVPEGEIESFYREIGGHSNKWLNEVLTKDLKNDPELRPAREFVKLFSE